MKIQKQTWGAVGIMSFVFVLAGWGISVLAAPTCSPGTELRHGVCVPNATGLSETSISTILINLLSWLLFILGTVAVLAFVISGIMYLTSAGNDNQIDLAKKYMVWSIVGVIVALSGLVIIFAVSNLLVGSPII